MEIWQNLYLDLPDASQAEVCSTMDKTNEARLDLLSFWTLLKLQLSILTSVGIILASG